MLFRRSCRTWIITSRLAIDSGSDIRPPGKTTSMRGSPTSSCAECSPTDVTEPCSSSSGMSRNPSPVSSSTSRGLVGESLEPDRAPIPDPFESGSNGNTSSNTRETTASRRSISIRLAPVMSSSRRARRARSGGRPSSRLANSMKSGTEVARSRRAIADSSGVNGLTARRPFLVRRIVPRPSTIPQMRMAPIRAPKPPPRSLICSALASVALETEPINSRAIFRPISRESFNDASGYS